MNPKPDPSIKRTCNIGFLSILGIAVLAFLPDNSERHQHILNVDELDIPDGTQSPFGSR